MSDSFRGYSFEYCGVPDPARSIYPQERLPDRVEPWTNRQWDKVQQLESEVVGWREKHAEVLLEIDKQKAKVKHGTKEKYSII